MKLRERGQIIYDLAVAYQCVVEAEAPLDVVAGLAYWLRVASREGLTSEDLEHVLEATAEGSISPLARKPQP